MIINLENILILFRNIRQKGFFHLLTANLLIQVVSFASQLLVAGLLCPDDIGRIKIIQTYLSFFSIIAGLGFNSSTLKLCSENRPDNEKESLFQSALFFTIISTISIYLIILLLNYFGLFSPDKLIKWLIPLGIFPIITNSIFSVFISYFQASKKIELISNLTISNKIISIIAIVLLTYIAGIYGYYIAYNISFILMLFVCFRAYKPLKKSTILSITHLGQFRTHWNFAKKSMFAYLLSEISAFIDILIISFLIADMQQVGYYGFALTLTVVLRIIPNTVQQITVPYLSSLSEKGNEFMLVFKRYNKILYLVVAITLLLILLITPSFIDIIFSGKYNPSIQYFPLLATGWSLRMLSQLQYGAIFSLGKIHYNVYTSIISMIFNSLTIIISINYFGIIGAAYSSILGGLVYTTCSIYFFKKAIKKMST